MLSEDEFACFSAVQRPSHQFMWANGMPIYEIYGLTEASALTHGNHEGQVKLGSIGKANPAIRRKISEDGEILISGPLVFNGYHKNEAATEEILVDGWLHTGDIGRVDADGFYYITDRKKHLIINSGGKNLSPSNIELAVKVEDSLISHVHAHGDKRPYISAIIAPSPIETLVFGKQRQLVSASDVEEQTKVLMSDPSSRSEKLNALTSRAVKDPTYLTRIREAITRGNKKLMHVEQIRRFIVLDRDFSQEAGEITPTMKLKRREVEQKFRDLFDRIYDDDNFAISV
eukprot:TRINITY_DN6743_c0_g1_i3.p1 TRINITY_DN6743_c0_g1~~TRINITY_DN6743_c0_g1_i3.p1  ORF type:complete len:287 (+),score=83.88 TRINITY_DN6743_c0_g1_i3:772-1632(+)